MPAAISVYPVGPARRRQLPLPGGQMLAYQRLGPAQAPAFFEGGLDDGIAAMGREVRAQIGAGAIATGHEQSGLAQGLALARDLGLAVFKDVAELGDRQLFFGAQRQHPQAAFVAQQPEQVRPIALKFQHEGQSMHLYALMQ